MPWCCAMSFFFVLTLCYINCSDPALIKTLQDLTHQMYLNNIQAFNPYCSMAETTPSVKVDVRKNFLKHCGIQNDQPTCMCSGIKHKKVQVAHILPKSSKQMILLNLRINDINDTRNLLWLAPGIEKAFDRMQLSFIPCLTEGLIQKYKLKIWDPECLNVRILNNDMTSKTIGDLVQEDVSLDFTIKSGQSEHSFFRRCLAYQALCSYYYKEGEFPSSSNDVDNLGDFSSLSEVQRGILSKNIFSDSNMIISREIRNEEEEEEDIDEEKEAVEVVTVKKKKFKKKKKCYNCYQAGHIRRNCPKKK